MAYVRVPNPFAQQGTQLGAGDIAKKVIKKTLDVEPCPPCEKRRRAMNRWLQFYGTRRK